MEIAEFSGKSISSRNIQPFAPKVANVGSAAPPFFDKSFVDFLKENGTELKSEFLIPSVINDLMDGGHENVEVLQSNARWFGVTYKDDKPHVMSEIQKLVDSGVYPRRLFN